MALRVPQNWALDRLRGHTPELSENVSYIQVFEVIGLMSYLSNCYKALVSVPRPLHSVSQSELMIVRLSTWLELEPLRKRAFWSACRELF